MDVSDSFIFSNFTNFNKMTQKDILAIRTERDSLFGADDSDPRIDSLAKELWKALEENIDTLDCDFVLETIASMGGSPSLVNDDNGMWAVTEDGYQPVVFGDERLLGAITLYFDEGEVWQPSIKEAIKYYVLHSGEEKEDPILDWEKFIEIEPGALIAGGIALNAPDQLYMTSDRVGEELIWVAIKGFADDWAIYTYWKEEGVDQDYVKSNGDKVASEQHIKFLVKCTEEVYKAYRW